MNATERQQKHRAALKQRGGKTIIHDLSPEANSVLKRLKYDNRTQTINRAIVAFGGDK